MIIHLEKEQLKQARRDLLRDDVYIIFVDALRQYHQEGYTTLARQNCIFRQNPSWETFCSCRIS